MKVNIKANIKKLWKKAEAKVYTAGAVTALALTPSTAGAEAPSAYVNKISDGLFAEILKVAPKIALVVIGFSFLMYIMSGDEHKKSKHKSTAYIAIVAYLILLVLKPLLGWLDGLI
ncbi:hypothetical protein [Peribacillus asahii]|uniref:hypothetical protein n=1 Tax=Peribacillus asahii TaxID=228899 RepID=UPI002079AC2A|nr:hypothetical protein [Peribacillus asahii]USK72637.1 hypothetical protein LIS76_23620 [Peribacillus asahii]USK72753.1 hypothetical protein LIS76_23800 [Peribacillus asahii]